MNILVDAFTEKNLGDDLFLKILFDRYSKNIEWYVICSSNEKLTAFKNYKNVKRYDRKVQKFKNFDAVINIGGSIFIQGGHWWIRQLISRMKYAFPMKLRHKPVFIVGCNFGPCNSRLMYLLNKVFIKYFVTDICFRDRQSYKLFDTIKHSRYNPDIVFGLDVTNIVKDKDHNKVGICVMNFESERINECFASKMAELTIEFNKQNKTVEYFSFCKTQNDAEAYARIKNKLGKEYDKKIKFLEYDGDIKNFLEEFSSCHAIITLRFHSLVLAQLMKIKYYPIVYSNKTVNLLQDQEYPYDFSKISEINHLNIRKLFAQLRQPLFMSLRNEKSQKNFSEIDDFILKKR